MNSKRGLTTEGPHTHTHTPVTSALYSRLPQPVRLDQRAANFEQMSFSGTRTVYLF